MPNPNPTPATPASSTPVTPAQAPVASKPTDVKPNVTNSAQAAPVVKAVEEMFDVQIDGKVEKRSKKEILEAYQLRQLSDKKRSEADKVLGEYKKLQEVAGKDPIKFMKAMGYDFDDIATKYLSKKAEDSMKDPKVLEAERTKAELEHYKKWVEDQKTQQAQTQKEQAIATERSKIHAEIIEAIEANKELGMPVDEEMIIAIAQKMILQDKAKKPLNAKEALPEAYKSTQKWLQGMASKMEGEALIKWLGDDTAKKIRKYDLAQLKSKRASTAPQAGSAVKPQEQKKDAKTVPYKTWSQFKSETLDNIK
jgi:hypothetical protein